MTLHARGADGNERIRRAAFVVGCDGSRSVVRTSAGSR
ncbi:FAD-dependent monooxygenase [Kineosporia mesophila]|nr:FAD-dependent monooxygenase [Kineosporia mesophila]